VKTILEGIEKLPGAKTADPHRFIDLTILDELEKEGFSKHCTGTETASDSLATTLAR
jgi:hypothetical protein